MTLAQLSMPAKSRVVLSTLLSLLSAVAVPRAVADGIFPPNSPLRTTWYAGDKATNAGMPRTIEILWLGRATVGSRDCDWNAVNSPGARFQYSLRVQCDGMEEISLWLTDAKTNDEVLVTFGSNRVSDSECQRRLQAGRPCYDPIQYHYYTADGLTRVRAGHPDVQQWGSQQSRLSTAGSVLPAVQTYRDQALGFAVSYGSAWMRVQPTPQAQFILHPSDSVAPRTLSIGVVKAPPGTDVIAAVRRSPESIAERARARFSDAAFVSADDTEIGGHPAFSVATIFTIRNHDRGVLTGSVQILAEKDGKVYVVTIEAPGDSFESTYEKYFVPVLESFAFL